MRPRGSIQIVAVGKLRDRHWAAAQALYAERLGRYTQLRIVEVKDWMASLPEAQAVEKEGQALIAASPEARARLALAPDGRSFTSLEWAEFLRQQIDRHGRLAFLIGGPAGLSRTARAACQAQVSLSMLTFPHELARIVLLEQLYRGFTIGAGEKYHR